MRAPKDVDLKCWQPYYGMSERGEKPFELRVNDRDYQVGDILHLQEFDPLSQSYTGKVLHRRVLSVVEHSTLTPGAVCMGLAEIPPE